MLRATRRFWRSYRRLPAEVRERADRALALLRENPRHPSLRLRTVGPFRSIRIDLAHRALAVAEGDDLVWVWIGTHDGYDRMLRQR